MSIIIRNGRVLLGEPAQEVFCDIKIEQGLITETGSAVRAENARVIDASGKLVLPGLVDTHSHYISGSGAGFYMAVSSGVTTALEPIVGDVRVARQKVAGSPVGMTCACLYMLAPGRSLSGISPARPEIEKVMESAVSSGAWGVKILGAHYPFTPEATALMIQIAAEKQIPLMLHAGSTVSRDDFNGMQEAVTLADGNPFILAHVNTYCTGSVLGDQCREALEALDLLKKNPQIISESTLSPLSCIGTKMDENDIPASLCMIDILSSLGYDGTYQGMLKAVEDRKLLVSGPLEDARRFDFLEHNAGVGRFKEQHGAVTIGYAKHSMLKNAICASGKNQEGDFIISTLSTDGGLVPRNVVLEKGLGLVDAGILSLPEFVQKSSRNGAKILGLSNKGVISPGFDGDIVIADPISRKAETVISGGKTVFCRGIFSEADNTFYAQK